MKITQEVREFARKQNSDSFPAADALTPGEAERGMDAMSEQFKAKGSEIYLPAAE